MIDTIINSKISLLQTEIFTKIMIFVTNIGDKYAIGFFSLILLAMLLFHKKDYFRSKVFSLTMGLGVVLSQGLKHIIQRARPTEMLIAKDGFSMPSGHATISMAFFGSLIYLFQKDIKNKYLKITFIALNAILILLIGFSRLYLNVHWFTDVLAGYILGLICIFVSIPLSKKVKLPFFEK